MGHFDPEWGCLVPELPMAAAALRGDSHLRPLPWTCPALDSSGSILTLCSNTNEEAEL